MSNSLTAASSPPPLPPREQKMDTKKEIKSMLFFLNSKRTIGSSWSYILYLSILVDLGLLIVLLVFNFMGKVPSIDFYWSILLHICHLFSWAMVYACVSKNFGYNFYIATMVLYVFLFLLDMAAFIWKLISLSLCDPATSTMCKDNQIYGYIGVLASGLLILWDIVVFVLVLLTFEYLLFYVKSKTEKNAAILLEMEKRARSEKTNNGSSSSTFSSLGCNEEVLENYKTLVTEPESNLRFKRRAFLVFAFAIEPLIFFGLLVIMTLGLVINERFMWSIFLNIIHSFSWVFLVSCVYNNYSKNFFRATVILYILNIILDSGAFIWRATELALCDSNTNVDCVFRVFPGWFPMVLMSGFLIVIDIIAISTLLNLYAWIFTRIWYVAAYAERCIAKYKGKQESVSTSHRQQRQQRQQQRQTYVNKKNDDDEDDDDDDEEDEDTIDNTTTTDENDYTHRHQNQKEEEQLSSFQQQPTRRRRIKTRNQ